MPDERLCFCVFGLLTFQMRCSMPCGQWDRGIQNGIAKVCHINMCCIGAMPEGTELRSIVQLLHCVIHLLGQLAAQGLLRSQSPSLSLTFAAHRLLHHSQTLFDCLTSVSFLSPLSTLNTPNGKHPSSWGAVGRSSRIIAFRTPHLLSSFHFSFPVCMLPAVRQ